LSKLTTFFEVILVGNILSGKTNIIPVGAALGVGAGSPVFLIGGTDFAKPAPTDSRLTHPKIYNPTEK
jgi:hypothetical protein